jgi:hypothetical protein
MLGLITFNIVFVGTGFPVEQVQVTSFDFHGHRPKIELHAAPVFQASVDEYSLQVLAERFQVTANSSKATEHRIKALVAVARTFADEYVGKRAIYAVGHNFQGSFESAMGDASAFMQHLAFPEDFKAALSSQEEPVLSLRTKFRMADETASLIRLEPLKDDPARVFYDANVSWGQAGEPLPMDIGDILDRYSQSVADVSALLERLARIGASSSEESVS